MSANFFSPAGITVTLYQIINYYAPNPKNEKGSNADGVLRVSWSAYIRCASIHRGTTVKHQVAADRK